MGSQSLAKTENLKAYRLGAKLKNVLLIFRGVEFRCTLHKDLRKCAFKYFSF